MGINRAAYRTGLRTPTDTELDILEITEYLGEKLKKNKDLKREVSTILSEMDEDSELGPAMKKRHVIQVKVIGPPAIMKVLKLAESNMLNDQKSPNRVARTLVIRTIASGVENSNGDAE